LVHEGVRDVKDEGMRRNRGHAMVLSGRLQKLSEPEHTYN